VDTASLPPLVAAGNRGDNLFRIVSVGRLSPAKAHHILIASVARLVRSGRTNIRLTIIGEGPLRSALEETILHEALSDHVLLAGACNYDRVLEYYKQSNVFALASFAEGVPVVLMEAMALGIPCVSTTIAGIPELIRTEIDGLLTRPADPDAFAAALARLIDDAELRERLAHAGRQRVCEHYDLAHNVERLGQTFRAYIAAANGQALPRKPAQVGG
jgi:glycosyltransferase involved in cell wall biosynthesis